MVVYPIATKYSNYIQRSLDCSEYLCVYIMLHNRLHCQTLTIALYYCWLKSVNVYFCHGFEIIQKLNSFYLSVTKSSMSLQNMSATVCICDNRIRKYRGSAHWSRNIFPRTNQLCPKCREKNTLFELILCRVIGTEDLPRLVTALDICLNFMVYWLYSVYITLYVIMSVSPLPYMFVQPRFTIIGPHINAGGTNTRSINKKVDYPCNIQ